MQVKTKKQMSEFCSIIWEAIGPDAMFIDTHGMPDAETQYKIAGPLFDAIKDRSDAEIGAIIRRYAAPYLDRVMPMFDIDPEALRREQAIDNRERARDIEAMNRTAMGF